MNAKAEIKSWWRASASATATWTKALNKTFCTEMSWCSPLLNCLHNGQENSVEYQLSVTCNGKWHWSSCGLSGLTKYLKFHIPFVLWSVGRFLFIGKKSLIVSQLTAICHCRNFEGISLGHTDVSGCHHSCLTLHSDGHKKKSKESWILVFKKNIYISRFGCGMSPYILTSSFE